MYKKTLIQQSGFFCVVCALNPDYFPYFCTKVAEMSNFKH